MTLISDFVDGRSPPQLYETYLSPGLFQPWADELLALEKPYGACLDIGCGTGVVSRKLAPIDAVDMITAIDVAEPMVTLAKSIADANGLGERIDFRVASALELPFAENRFTRAYCQQALQFFPDKVQGLREAKRVLQPGGRLTAAVWTAAGDGNPVFAAFESIVARTFGDDLIPFGPFSFGNADALRSVIEEAGLTVRSLEPRTLHNCLPDVTSFVLFDLLFLGRPDADGVLQPIIAADDPAGDEPVAELIQAMKEEVAEFVQPDGTLLAPMTAHVFVAQV